MTKLAVAAISLFLLASGLAFYPSLAQKENQTETKGKAVKEVAPSRRPDIDPSLNVQGNPGTGEDSAGNGVALPQTATGPSYSQIPQLPPEQIEELEKRLDHVNLAVPIRQDEQRNVIPLSVNPPTEPILDEFALSNAKTNTGPQAANDFTYRTVHDLTTAEASSNRSVINEPSVGNMGSTVFYSGNWYAARSTDGGQSFTYVNPFNTFPSINGGFCCDQVVNYASNQDMMLWALQYIKDSTSGTLRIARAVGSTSVANNTWVYYDFNPQKFGFASGNWMDFPTMTVGATYLYATSNVFTSGNDNFTGSVIWRIPLSELLAGGTVHFDYLTRTDIGSLRCTEGASTTMYWAALLGTSQVRIYRWDDNSTTIFHDDVNINSFTFLNQDGLATSPDGTNWAARAFSKILGAWVSGGVVGLMWPAKQGGSFPYPYTIIARFNQSNRALISQNQLWSSQTAWLYPTVSVNSAGNLAGLAAYGGGTYYPGTNIWISDDVQNGFNPLALYGATASNVGPSSNAWGDYHTIRLQKDNPNTWVASTYYLKDNASNVVPRYLWFGRERDFAQITVGQGAPNPQLFIDAFNRSGFSNFVTLPPINIVHRWDCSTCDSNNPSWGKGLIQDFNGTTSGVHDALMLADTNTSFVAQIYGGMWDKFIQLGDLNYNSANTRMLGYPIADRNCSDYNAQCFTDAQLVSPFGTSYHYQRFQGGAFVLHKSGSRVNQTFEVHGAIRARWQVLGGPSSGSYGLPITDEYAFQSKRRSDFEGGSICYNPATGQTEDGCTTVSPPPAPTANAATNVTSSGFTTNWSSSSGATGYRLDVSTSSTFSSYLSGYQDLDVGNVLSRSVSGLSAATTYNYRVRAYNTGGTSGNSGTISVTTTTNVQATVQTNPSVRSFTVDGVTYTSAQSFTWTAGSSHSISTSSPQSGGTGTQYVFSSWSDGGAISHTVAPSSNITYTANFTTQYLLTMNAGAGGTVSPPSGYFNSGQGVSISASPLTGYSFSSWNGVGSGSFSGTNNPASVTMNGPITETASFSAVPPPPTGTNFALASNGGLASASSTLDSGRLPSAANNGDRKGIHWGSDPSTGSGWHDATSNAYPDWLQIDFNGTPNINEIDVFTVQDNYSNPIDPNLSTTFSAYGITAFDVQYWDGASWLTVSGGSVTGNNKVWRQFTFASPIQTAKIRVLVNNSLAGYSRITELEAWGPGVPPSVNVALTSNGGIASASSTLDSGRLPLAAINGDRKGSHWGTDPSTGSGWHDATSNSFPDFLQVDFNGSKTINEIDVFSVQDNYTNPAEPTDAMTFSLYGLTIFDVQYWNVSAWVTVPGGSVSGNNLVKRKVTFSPISTTKIRVLVNGALAGYSRITEVEAWTAPNVALASNGGVASASSTLDSGRLPSAANNGDRKGIHWGSDPSTGSGWHDATSNSYPDFLQIDFSGSKTIGEIDVFSVQDNYTNPAEPTDAMTFSLYGITTFDVQYWNGSSWVTVPGGSVIGNNLVQRKFSFAPITTTKIRILVNSSLAGYSRIVEVEAY